MNGPTIPATHRPAAAGAAASSYAAIGAMVVATMCYLAGDTAVKLATVTLPVGQIIAVRGAITVVLVTALAAGAGVIAHWRHALSGRILLRGAFDAATTLFFTHALVGMAIADATAIINSVPIVATVLAIAILKERVGLRRWSAILVGFAGVVLVLRPSGEGIDGFGLLACGATISLAGREIVTRRIAPDVPSLIVTLCSVVMVALAGTAMTVATGEWVAFDRAGFALIAAAAVALVGAYHLSVVAVRLGEISLVGPFRYLIIVWGLLVGFVVWGDVPDLAELTGMALIALSGLYVLHRERLARRAARPKGP